VVIYPAESQVKENTDSSHNSPNITWDQTQYEVQSATLTLEAQSNAAFGGECHVGMNGKLTTLAANWAFGATNMQNRQLDVTSFFNYGVNDFWVHYGTTSVLFSSSSLTFSLNLQVVLKYIGTGIPSANPLTVSSSLTLPSLPWYYWVAIAAAVVGLIVVLVVVARKRKG
jgi:hypothetical protein